MTTGDPPRPRVDRVTVAFLAVAVLYGIGLIIASFHVSADPSMPGSPSLVAQNGLKYLGLSGAPLAATIVIAAVLLWHRRTGARVPIVIAWTTSVATVVAAVLGVLTIGRFLAVPAVLFLAMSARTLVARPAVGWESPGRASAPAGGSHRADPAEADGRQPT